MSKDPETPRPDDAFDATMAPEGLHTIADDRTLDVAAVPAHGLPTETEASFESRYSAGRLLGAGGMGEVVLCRDHRVGRDVAMKRMLEGGRADTSAEHRFVREARVQGRLEHPSVVPVYDLGVAPDGQPYFVMKRVRGETLADVLEGLAARDSAIRARYPRRKLLRVLVQLLNALDFAHSHGVVHRDIKPANVMLGGFGEVYVLDWGVARVEGSSESLGGAEPVMGEPLDVHKTRAGAILGTPGYAAPEQLEARPGGLDGRADLYAVGVILFELLTAAPLFSADKTAMRRVMETLAGVDALPSERAPSQEIPPELDAICAKAMAFEPEARFASARDFGQALEDVLDGEQHSQLRDELAERHEEAAREAAEVALRGRGDEALEARATAVREVARALALKPSSPEGMRTLMRLLTEPPEEVPEAVQRRLVADDDRRIQQSFHVAAWIFGSWSLGIPLLMAMGVQETGSLIAAGIMLLVIVVNCVLGARNPSSLLQYGIVINTTVTVVLLSRALGPFLLVPAILGLNSLTFAFTRDLTKRIHFTLIIYLGFITPLLLEWSGVWAASYRFAEGQLIILERGVTLEPDLTIALMVFAYSMIILVSVFWPHNIRKLFDGVETRAAINTWQIEQLIPEAGREDGFASEDAPRRSPQGQDS